MQSVERVKTCVRGLDTLDRRIEVSPRRARFERTRKLGTEDRGATPTPRRTPAADCAQGAAGGPMSEPVPVSGWMLRSSRFAGCAEPLMVIVLAAGGVLNDQ